MAHFVLAVLHVVKNEDLPPSLRAPEPPQMQIAEELPPEPPPVEPSVAPVEEAPGQPYLRRG